MIGDKGKGRRRRRGKNGKKERVVRRERECESKIIRIVERKTRGEGKRKGVVGKGRLEKGRLIEKRQRLVGSEIGRGLEEGKKGNWKERKGGRKGEGKRGKDMVATLWLSCSLRLFG